MQIIVIIGAICSGKSTYAAQHYDLNNVVDIGDIVRMLTDTEKRTHNANLDIKIIAHLHNRIMSASHNYQQELVVTGIRQFSILNYLEILCEDIKDMEICRIVLDVPKKILKKRYQKHTRIKDNDITFEQAFERDDKLGYRELLDYVMSINHRLVKNYTEDEE